MKTAKEISQLRSAFKLQYKKFQENFNEIGKRMFELCKQADVLLDCMEKLNEIELDADNLDIDI